MAKKLLILGVMVIMALSLTLGLAGCGEGGLAQYKADAKAEITSHAAGLTESDYTPDNWALIGQKADEGKTAVDDARTKAAVDTAKTAAIQAMDGVSKTAEAIEAAMKLQARQTYLDEFVKPRYPEATIDDVSLFPFLGIYNNSLVASFYGGQYHGEYPDIVDSQEIDGLTFEWSRGYPILFWNDGSIYPLSVAFGQGLLTKENLIAVHGLYYNAGEPILKTGVYAIRTGWAQILLKEDGEYSMQQFNISRVIAGQYSQVNEKLSLIDGEYELVFTIDDGKVVFVGAYLDGNKEDWFFQSGTEFYFQK